MKLYIFFYDELAILCLNMEINKQNFLKSIFILTSAASRLSCSVKLNLRKREEIVVISANDWVKLIKQTSHTHTRRTRLPPSL